MSGDVVIFSSNKSFLLRKSITDVSRNHLLLTIDSNNFKLSSIRFCGKIEYSAIITSESLKNYFTTTLIVWDFYFTITWQAQGFYLNSRVFLLRNYRLIVSLQKFDVLKTKISPRSKASRTSNFHSSVFIVLHTHSKTSILNFF